MATIAENLTLLKSTKANIKSAIEAKGVSDVGDKFSDYPAKIASIPTGSNDTLYTKGLRFGYSQGEYTDVGKAINNILNQEGTLIDVSSMFREVQIDNYWEVDLSKKVFIQTTIVDATGMFYNSKIGTIKWPIQPGAGITQINAKLMFASCSAVGNTLEWPSWLTVTNAGSMFTGGSFSDLNLGNLDLATNNVNTAYVAGGILYGISVQNLYFQSSFFNFKDEYDLSSLSSLSSFDGLSLSDDQQAWQSLVQAMTGAQHPSQNLILPTAWQTYIQQYNLESSLTSAWGSVVYQ